MKIELGKTYMISPARKKSFVEENRLTNEYGLPEMIRTIVWRSGSFNVKVNTYGQQMMLEDAQKEDWDSWIDPYNEFSTAEFIESWDGCSEDWESPDNEYVTNLQENFYDTELEDEYFSFDSYLEEAKGYDYEETTYFLEGQITVEEVVDSE